MKKKRLKLVWILVSALKVVWLKLVFYDITYCDFYSVFYYLTFVPLGTSSKAFSSCSTALNVPLNLTSPSSSSQMNSNNMPPTGFPSGMPIINFNFYSNGQSK